MKSADGWNNLTINNIQLTDAGLYRCHTDGGIGEEIYVQLHVQAAQQQHAQVADVTEEENYPTMQSEKKDGQVVIINTTPLPAAGIRQDTTYKSAKAGTRVSLSCLVGTQNILWRRHNEMLHVNNISIGGLILPGFDDRFSIGQSYADNYHLVINNIVASDNGRYECITDNGLGESHSNVLFVTGQPDIVQSTQSPATSTRPETVYMTANAGTPVSFPCLVGPRTVLWRHYDETLHVKNISIDGLILREFIDIYSIGKSYEDNNHLVINNARQSDTGRYECVTYSGISASCVLFVTGTSGFSFTHIFLIVLLTVLASVFGVGIVCLKSTIFSCWRTRDGTGNDVREGQEEKMQGTSLEMETLLTSVPIGKSDRLTILATIGRPTDNYCYFAELNGTYCMADMSGKLTTFRYSIDKTGKSSFDKRYEITHSETYEPSGFTASKENNCLYIGNRFKRRVYRVVLRTDERKFNERFSIFIPQMEKDNEHPKSLSAMSHGRVAVLVAIEQTFSRTWRGRIDVHAADGAPLVSVNTPSHVLNPWGVAYSGKNTFTLTYGLYDFGVIRLDIECRKLAEQDSSAGLKVTRSIKYDNVNKSVYVVEAGRNRIVQMGTDLQIKCVIHDWGENSKIDDTRPICIALNEEKTHMIIGFDSGRVSFYSFDQPNE